MSSLKQKIHGGLKRLAEDPSQLQEHLSSLYHPEAQWRGPYPFNEMGIAEAGEQFWKPFLHSFPDLERRDFIFIAGDFRSEWFVGAVGHYCGTFHRPWLGLPPTGKTLYLRYGEIHKIREGRIIQSSLILDILDFIRQAGYWPLPPSLGREGRWSAPITGDGLVFQDSDPEESARNLKLTLDMQASLNSYDDRLKNSREDLLNMSQKNFWHPRMMWYGPSGIGTTRGLQGFVDHHQRPFRLAFPNRKGGMHYVQIADGKYSATSGWPSVHGKHLGGGWLGTTPTGRKVFMRVMDFYLIDEGLIRENWVPIDIIHILLQLGFDVFERLHYFIHPEQYR